MDHNVINKFYHELFKKQERLPKEFVETLNRHRWELYDSPEDESVITYPGKLIIIDGPEGSGKSLVMSKLMSLYAGNNKIRFGREPGGTRIGSQIRKIILDSNNMDLDPVASMLLYLADRTEHVNNFIKPCLKAGTNYISDRYESSTYAMQGYAEGNLDLFIKLNDVLKTKPCDIFIHIDVDSEVGLERSFAKANRLNRDTDPSNSNTPDELKFEKMGFEFNKKVRQGFFEYKENYLNLSCKRFYIDTTNLFEDDVFNQVRSFLESLNIGI